MSFFDTKTLNDSRIIKVDTGDNLLEKIAVRWVHMLSPNYLLVQLQNPQYHVVTYVNFIKTHEQPIYPSLRPVSFPAPKGDSQRQNKEHYSHIVLIGSTTGEL
jgi:hypothetical protein